MVSVGSGKGTPLDGRSAMFEALGTLSNQIAMLYSVAIDQKRAINLSIIGTLGAPFINAHRAALLSIKNTTLLFANHPFNSYSVNTTANNSNP